MDGRKHMVLQVRYSEIEWLALERMARQKRISSPAAAYDENGLKHLRAYLNGTLHRMAKSARDQELLLPPDNIQRPYNTFQIAGDIVEDLELLAAQFHTPVTRMVGRLVFHPLLREYFDQYGYHP